MTKKLIHTYWIDGRTPEIIGEITFNREEIEREGKKFYQFTLKKKEDGKE